MESWHIVFFDDAEAINPIKTQPSPVSPVVANLCMEEIEESAINSSSVPPKIWKRYVDVIDITTFQVYFLMTDG